MSTCTTKRGEVGGKGCKCLNGTVEHKPNSVYGECHAADLVQVTVKWSSGQAGVWLVVFSYCLVVVCPSTASALQPGHIGESVPFRVCVKNPTTGDPSGLTKSPQGSHPWAEISHPSPCYLLDHLPSARLPTSVMDNFRSLSLELGRGSQAHHRHWAPVHGPAVGR